MKFKRWMLIVLVPIITCGGWFSYVNVNKYYSYPYPDMYNMLVNEKCQNLLTSSEGNVSELIVHSDSQPLWFYEVNRVIGKEEYHIKYFITAKGKHIGFNEQEGRRMSINVIRGNKFVLTGTVLEIEYSDLDGIVKMKSSGNFNDTDYKIFKDMLSNDVESCKR